MPGALQHEIYRQLRGARPEDVLPLALTKALTTGHESGVEVLVDLVIGWGETVAAVGHLFELVPRLSTKAPHFQKLLSIATGASRPSKVNETPVSLGSYLASRFLLVGAELAPDLRSSMYALCSAIRTLSPVEAFRWRFVIHRELGAASFRRTQAPLVSAARDLLRQANAFCKLISTIYVGEDIEWESSVLRSR